MQSNAIRCYVFFDQRHTHTYTESLVGQRKKHTLRYSFVLIQANLLRLSSASNASRVTNSKLTHACALGLILTVLANVYINIYYILVPFDPVHRFAAVSWLWP